MSREHIPVRGLISALLALVATTALLLVLQPQTSAAPGPVSRLLPSSVSHLQSAGLQIDKEGPDRVTVLDTITYTIRITNTSGQTLRNVVISDTYSSNIQPSSAPFALAEYNGNYIASGVSVDWFTHTRRLDLKRGEIYWGLGDLPPGTIGTIVLTMSVPYTLQPTYKTPGPEMGPSLLGNSLTATVPGFGSIYDYTVAAVVGPVLKVQKSVQTETGLDGQERVGRLLTYTIRVDNLSTAERKDSWPATGLKVWDTLPNYLDFITATASVPGVSLEFVPTSRLITWTFPADFVLNPGETTYVTFTARITLTAPTDQNSVQNPRDKCWAISAEMVRPVNCTSDLNVRVLTPQYKTVETTSPPSQADRSYPNRPVTYTIYVYNPLQEVVTGVVVTDVMPSTFYYQYMVRGPNPASVLSNVVRWENLTLPANGVISFTFRAWIGPDTPLEIGCNNKEYENQVFVTAPAFPVVYFTKAHGKVTVVPQLRVSKSVAPGVQVPGSEVVYTITLENVGDTPIGNIIITDTLPPAFRFSSMVSSPPPGLPKIDPTSPNVIWWDDIPTIQPGAKVVFSFRAIVDGDPLQTYKNKVEGFSPDTSICRLETASVQVDSPIKSQKTADPPLVVQWETLQYSYTVRNISAVRDYQIDRFLDTLPSGFQSAYGQNYTYVISPPVTLLRNRGNAWSHIFTATVVGQGTGTQWCNDLGPAGKDFPQQKNTFGVHTILPDGWWLNAESAATVRVLPHVSLSAVADPNPVGRISPLTVTLLLTNNLRGSFAAPVTLTGVSYELPPGFTVLAQQGENPPDECTTSSCVWRNRVVPASGTLRLTLRLQSPFTTGTYSRYASALPENTALCIPRYSLSIQVVNGVELKKTPNLQSVGPFGLVDYTIEATNLTGGPVYNLRITDTLEGGFQYVGTTSGPQPISTSPLVWEIPYLGPKGSSGGADKATIQFRARAGVLLGSWYNMVDGASPSTYVTRTTNYMRDVEVRVVPGVGLYKVAEPTTVMTGQTVVYTITLYNASGAPIRNIRITDTLPAGFTYQATIAGTPPVLTSPVVIWAIAGPVNNGDRIVLAFRARVGNDLASGRYFNRVSGYAEKAVSPYDPVLVPDTGDTAPVYVQGIPTVQRTKTVEPNEVRAGGEVTYTIVLYNESDSPQTLRLTDTLPVSVTWAGLLEGPAPVMTSPVVVWDSISVEGNQTVTLRFRAAVDRLARSGTFYNRLDARAGTFVLPPVEAAPLTVQEIPRVDAQVSIDDGRTIARPGDALEYTVLFTNASPVAIENVVLTATLDPADYLIVTSGDWGMASDGVYTYPVGSMASGEARSIPLPVQIHPDIPDTFWTVTATVDIGYETVEEVIEENLANNTGRDVDILRGPDLVVTRITWQPAQPTAGYPMTFYVTVKNQGVDAVTQQWNGNAPTWLFVTEVYAKDPQAGPPTDVFDHIGGSCTSDGSFCARWDYTQWSRSLGVNEERTLPFSVTLPAGTYRTHAQVDVSWAGSPPWGQPFGLIREAREDNNIYSGDLLVVYPWRRVYLPLVLKNR
jgi:uncharacterized repeat protein (TIGR01451 family)